MMSTVTTGIYIARMTVRTAVAQDMISTADSVNGVTVQANASDSVCCRQKSTVKGVSGLKKQYLLAKIKTYEGNAERQQHKADCFYAEYKATGDPDAYRQAQYYYAEAQKSRDLVEVYKKMLANGEYE